MDIFDKTKRSNIMSKVKGKETTPEILVRKFLFSQGFRFRKNVKQLPGTPDIVLPKYKIVIFIHGCFWHGHEDCRAGRLPSTNVDFWYRKIQKNKERDIQNESLLRNLGWSVLIVWGCELKSKIQREETLARLTSTILDRGE